MPQELLPEDNIRPPALHTEPPIQAALVEPGNIVHDTAAVAALLTEVKQKLAERKRHYISTFVPIISLALLMDFLPLFLIKPWANHVLMIFLIYLAIITSSTVFVLKRVINKPFTFDLKELSRIGGLNAVGVLIEAASQNISIDQAKAVYSVLTPLLYQLKASDAHLLTPEHRRLLHAQLQAELAAVSYVVDGLPLKLGILKALEQVGDRSFYPVVKGLCNLGSRTDRQRQLREAARNCLPFLEAHMGEVTASMTLLRSAAAIPEKTSTLLRPADASTPTPSDELLRPTDVS